MQNFSEKKIFTNEKKKKENIQLSSIAEKTVISFLRLVCRLLLIFRAENSNRKEYMYKKKIYGITNKEIC